MTSLRRFALLSLFGLACRSTPDPPPVSVPAPAPSPVAAAGPDTTGLVGATQAYFRGEGASPGRVVVEALADSVARVRVFPLDPNTADPATAFMRRTAAGWRGLSYGTAFSSDDLDALGIPPAARL